MPLAQLADPWQKMAVESPSDSAEVSAAGRRGRRAPSPRLRRLPLFPGAAPLTTFLGSHLVPGAGFCFGSLGFAHLSIPPSFTLTSPWLFFGGAAAGVAARGVLEWALRLCKKPVLINFAWGKQEAEREPAGSWEVWPCRLRGLLRNLSDFGVMGSVHPGAKT